MQFDIGSQKHSKPKHQLSFETQQTIVEQEDVVSFCQFSPDGTKLATGSVNKTVIIYDVIPEILTVRKSMMFDHPFEINYLSWSPNSKFLMACGLGRYPDIWLWDVIDGTSKLKHCHDKNDLITSCCWFDGGETIVLGGTRGKCFKFDLNNKPLRWSRCAGVISLLCRSDGKSVLAADVYGQIRSIDLNNGRVEHSIQELGSILTLTLNKTDDKLLVHTLAYGIHLWDLQSWYRVRRFEGIDQRLFNSTIRSSFGGSEHEFFASGSKDNNVYLWNIKYKKPFKKLIGHTKKVNCVSWNPVYHQMLASASDDFTVRIWVSTSINAYDDIESELREKSKGLWLKVRDSIRSAFKRKYARPDLLTNKIFEKDICFDDFQDPENTASSINKAEQFDETDPSKVDPESDQNLVLYENRNEEELKDNSEGQTVKYSSATANEVRDNPTNVQSQEAIDGQFSGDPESQDSHPVLFPIKYALQEKEKDKALDIQMIVTQKKQNVNKSTSDNVSKSTSKAWFKFNRSV